MRRATQRIFRDERGGTDLVEHGVKLGLSLAGIAIVATLGMTFASKWRGEGRDTTDDGGEPADLVSPPDPVFCPLPDSGNGQPGGIDALFGGPTALVAKRGPISKSITEMAKAATAGALEISGSCGATGCTHEQARDAADAAYQDYLQRTGGRADPAEWVYFWCGERACPLREAQDNYDAQVATLEEFGNCTGCANRFDECDYNGALCRAGEERQRAGLPSSGDSYTDWAEYWCDYYNQRRPPPRDGGRGRPDRGRTGRPQPPPEPEPEPCSRDLATRGERLFISDYLRSKGCFGDLEPDPTPWYQDNKICYLLTLGLRDAARCGFESILTPTPRLACPIANPYDPNQDYCNGPLRP